MDFSEFEIPKDDDEAALWLLNVLGNPKVKDELIRNRLLAVRFIEAATGILSKLAKRDGNTVLSFLLDRATEQARKNALAGEDMERPE